MKRFIYMLAAFALMGAVSCQPDEEVAVHASFTTDKESYDVGDPVVLTNTSTAENALIAICKWELGKGVVSYETTPENISYDQAGEYVIKLTVTSDRGAKKSSFEKTIRVVDNNIRPVADFTWSPEKVVAGEPVQFTDRSTDEDGEVVAWEWKFGTTTSDKQNPEFTFAAQGATEVSLTVTDNKKGRNTKTVTIDVGRGAISLDLLWSYPYDDTKDAYVFGTSPAVSPDGEYVYVTSTGYSLVCFTKAGERLWAFDIGKDGASAENNSGSIKVQSPTPSVDEDGTVYALAGFNEPNKGAGGSAFYAVSGGAGGGSQVWHVNTGVNTSFRFLSPAVTEKYLFIVARNVPSGHQNFQVYDKSSGDLVDERHVNGGSYGGVLPLKNGMVIAGTGGSHGMRVFFPDGAGKWKFSCVKSNGREHNYGGSGKDATCEAPNGTQPASGPGGKVYILFQNQGVRADKSLGGGVVYCYDPAKTVYGQTPEPDWYCPVKGDCAQSGMGVALGEDGTVYAATQKTGSVAAHVTAISAQGVKRWEHAADGDINGVPAVDDQDFVYYNDRTTGKLVKLRPEDGSRVAEIKLADDPYTADLMAKDLVAWFEERLRSREPLTDHVRNLQQSLLKSTVAAANVKDKPSSGSGSAFALFDGAGSLSDGGDLFPAADAGTLPDMPAERRADDFTPLGAGEVQGAAYGYRTPRVIPAFREHLFYGLLLDMKAMYRRGAASAPLADTRSFCRYMADRIDRELAVE